MPLEAAQGLPDLVGSEDKQELIVKAGHVGLFVGPHRPQGHAAAALRLDRRPQRAPVRR